MITSGGYTNSRQFKRLEEIKDAAKFMSDEKQRSLMQPVQCDNCGAPGQRRFLQCTYCRHDVG